MQLKEETIEEKDRMRDKIRLKGKREERKRETGFCG